MPDNASPDRPPLDGVRVLDASQGVAGPHCGLLLGLLGAEVTKIEPPEGDWLRHLGQRVGDHGPHSWYLNRGKSARMLDLRQDADRAQMRELAAASDVVLTSYRPGVATRLGLDYAQLRALREDIVLCEISGYGAIGPRAEHPAVDGVLQAYCGWMNINATESGAPRTFPFFAIDMLAGLYAHQSVLAALIRRWRFGGGARVEVSLMESAAAFLGPRLLEIARAAGESPALFSSPNGAFRARDGWFLVAVTTQAQYVQVCQALDCGVLADDPRFASRELRITHRRELDALLAARFSELDVADCEARFQRAGAMGAIVRAPVELLSDPQMQAMGALLQLHTPAGPLTAVGIPGMSRGLQERAAPERGSRAAA
jgi:crotonobetainyl-CoA:carnitine CoA-transferase CaiB-like acyl-CoA transferase